MSVEEVTYYRVRCDEPDCKTETGNLGSDYSAWHDRNQAADDWTDSDGLVLADGRAFCAEHRPAEDEDVS